MKPQVDFDDIFDVWQPAWWENPWAVAGVIGVIFLLLFFVYWLLKKYWLYTKPVDPRTFALQQLYAINPEHGAQAKEFYTQLLIIMKNYLDARYDLQSVSKTEHELGDYVALQGPLTWVPAVKHIAQRAVTIKFAQEETAKDNLFDDYELIIERMMQEKMQEQRN